MIPGIIAASKRRGPPIEPVDPFFANVVSLAHFDGHDGPGGSATFDDLVSGRTWSTVGSGTQIDTAEKMFGRGSLFFAGTGGLRSNVVAGTNFGAGDFTVEFWMRVTNAGSGSRVAFDGRHTGTGTGVGIYLYVSNFALWVSAASNRSVYTLISGAWTHIAAARKDGVLRTFVDGDLVDEQPDSRTYTGGANVFLGQSFQNSLRITGHMDDFRLTRGVARYTSNFERPRRPFPAGP